MQRPNISSEDDNESNSSESVAIQTDILKLNKTLTPDEWKQHFDDNPQKYRRTDGKDVNCSYFTLKLF